MVSDYQQTHQQVADGCHITSGASATGRIAQTSGGRVNMRTLQEKRKLRRQRRRRNEILDGILMGSAMAMPAIFLWLGIVFAFMIQSGI